MSFGIIIKNNSRKFRPHFNRELTDRAHPNGQMIHTKEDYLRETKKRGLEPYDPSKVKKRETKPYAPSKDAREMATYIQNHGGASTKIKDWVRDKSGHKKARVLKNIDTNKGGDYACS